MDSNRTDAKISDYLVDQETAEREVQFGLSRWLEADDAVGAIYWDKKGFEDDSEFDISDYPTFTTNRSAIPDILVNVEGDWFVIEVKSLQEITNPDVGVRQTFAYWQRYVAGEMTYTVDDCDDPLDISGFLLATNYSPFGGLVPRYYENGFVNQGDSRLDVEQGRLPKCEFTVTSHLTRVMWKFANNWLEAVSDSGSDVTPNYAEDSIVKEEVGLGSLLSLSLRYNLDGKNKKLSPEPPAALYKTESGQHWRPFVSEPPTDYADAENDCPGEDSESSDSPNQSNISDFV